MIKLPPSSTHQYLRPPGLASLPESQEKAAGHIRGLPDHCRAGGGHNVGGGVPGLNSPPRPEGHREGGSLRAGVGALSRNCCQGGGHSPCQPLLLSSTLSAAPWVEEAGSGAGGGCRSNQPPAIGRLGLGAAPGDDRTMSVWGTWPAERWLGCTHMDKASSVAMGHGCLGMPDLGGAEGQWRPE